MISRHPFPGPGLGIRIIGPVTREALALLREADSIFIGELKEQGLSEGMLTLRRVGVLNMMRGKTSLEEVLRITMAD